MPHRFPDLSIKGQRYVVQVPLDPMAKPTIRSPTWKKWSDWAIALRAYVDLEGVDRSHVPLRMDVLCVFAIPKSRRDVADGDPYRQKPDGNHAWNAVADALYGRDELIAFGRFDKKWTRLKQSFMAITFSDS